MSDTDYKSVLAPYMAQLMEMEWLPAQSTRIFTVS